MSTDDKSKLTTPGDIRAIIQQAREAWITGDTDKFANLFTADGKFIVPGNQWIGPEAIRQVGADFAKAYSEVKIEIKRIIIEDNQAVVEWQWQDKEKATGKSSIADDAIVIEFTNGKISYWREYIDSKTPSYQA